MQTHTHDAAGAFIDGVGEDVPDLCHFLLVEEKDSAGDQGKRCEWGEEDVSLALKTVTKLETEAALQKDGLDS